MRIISDLTHPRGVRIIRIMMNNTTASKHNPLGFRSISEPTSCLLVSGGSPALLTRSERYYQRVGQAKTPEAMTDAFARGYREVGDRVMFRNGSAPGGWRSGTIIACGTRRARVAFTFYNGRRSERSVPYGEVRS
jgi:hypothetical protein